MKLAWLDSARRGERAVAVRCRGPKKQWAYFVDDDYEPERKPKARPRSRHRARRVG